MSSLDGRWPTCETEMPGRKDALTSNHFFKGEPKDGWLGNEHGPGSLARYLDPNCKNAFGSVFTAIQENDKVVASLAGTGRVHVMYYDEMKEDLGKELDRLSAFLGLKMSEAKREKVRA